MYLGVPAVAQWEWVHPCSTRTKVLSHAQHSGFKDPALLWHRLQLLLTSDPWPGNSICRGVATSEKKKKSIYFSHWFEMLPLSFSEFSYAVGLSLFFFFFFILVIVYMFIYVLYNFTTIEALLLKYLVVLPSPYCSSFWWLFLVYYSRWT